MLCTEKEIAAFFNVCKDTMIVRVQEHYGKKYTELMDEFIEVGKASLRRLQWQHAEKNVVMCIFLGKQYLGQVDSREVIRGNKDKQSEQQLTDEEKAKLKDLLEKLNAPAKQPEPAAQPEAEPTPEAQNVIPFKAVV